MFATFSPNKHRVTFTEAATVWTDPLALIAPDPEHSLEEEREWIVGTSHRERVLVVVYTTRGDGIRIISARKATPHERRRYEEESD
ncbi:hypothetical protein C7B79_24375 [Chroococcidiopsis cubana CCALA 043]|nr:hypothetical protein C7B79_24375 [Chroococcidiopsis cubana CCALA 043]